MNDKKNGRFEIRIPIQEKENFTLYCKSKKYNPSEFARRAIVNEMERDLHPDSNNSQSNLLLVNKLYNLTLAYSADLNNEYLECLEKEIFNEYQYYR